MLLQLQISVWFVNALYIIYAVLVLSSILVVISETRNAAKSLAWILALIFLPGLGLLLYLLFGQSMRHETLLSQSNREKLFNSNKLPDVDIDALALSENNKQLIKMCNKLDASRFYPGNDVHVYVRGQEKFDDLLFDIRNAQKFIHIQYFIFRDDDLGRRVCDALIEAVERGVEVRLLYDDMGCFTVDRRFFKNMEKHGIEVRAFMRIFHLRRSWRLNYRNHRKIVVIDGLVGYIGGMNVADRYVNGDKDLSWRDTHMRIAGPVVHGLQMSFSVDWCYESHNVLSDEKYFPQLMSTGDTGVQIILSGPTGPWNSIAMMCEKIVSMAHDYVYIQTPYFLPTDSLVYALQVAALSGVDVRIMIPQRTDLEVMRWGSFSYISQMLTAGVKVYLYQPGMLHAKTIVVDDELVSIGSANFDFRSFEHNFETNALVYGREQALRVKEDFMVDVSNCVLIDNIDLWRQRPLRHKIYESVVRLVSPVL
ncbi:MAG: cardiolipin synthase [Bacteroidaceae bacterium]|nr:cardiolipin synthase [Bacteroidaceae bacterium]